MTVDEATRQIITYVESCDGDTLAAIYAYTFGCEAWYNNDTDGIDL